MTGRNDIPRARRLRLTEVYPSIQGESTHVGKPCTFVRLTGCPLRCTWCDSTFTFTGGEVRDLDDVVAEVLGHGLRTVEVTGGEPLAQPNAIGLLRRLLDEGLEVLLETSGALPIDDVPKGVHVILDLKAPGSGEVERNRWENLAVLDDRGEIKIVLAGREDYLWAREVIRTRDLGRGVPVLLSPAWGLVSPREISAWMLEDRLPARLQVQLHKVVWDPSARGV